MFQVYWRPCSLHLQIWAVDRRSCHFSLCILPQSTAFLLWRRFLSCMTILAHQVAKVLPTDRQDDLLFSYHKQKGHQLQYFTSSDPVIEKLIEYWRFRRYLQMRYKPSHNSCPSDNALGHHNTHFPTGLFLYLGPVTDRHWSWWMTAHNEQAKKLVKVQRWYPIQKTKRVDSALH